MPQRFGQSTDYSQNFAYLARENQTRLEQGAARLDRKNQEEQAAEDELMFAKYAEGKVSGQQLIAYIQRRVRETSHDKAQQDKWKAALVEYENNVADELATAAYEESGDVNAFIKHWKERLASTKKGTPERTQIQKVLGQLREQRDGKALMTGADRIMRQIQRGKATTKDLIDYYKDAIASGKYDEEQKNNIRNTIAELQQKQKAEKYRLAETDIDQRLSRGDISPQEAARLKQENANKFGLQKQDPVAYAQLLG
jgi:translation initiation factor 2B subunit (eIF-2B alpha/beta/delta family)